jgi:hypothetical protein
MLVICGRFVFQVLLCKRLALDLGLRVLRSGTSGQHCQNVEHTNCGEVFHLSVKQDGAYIKAPSWIEASLVTWYISHWRVIHPYWHPQMLESHDPPPLRHSSISHHSGVGDSRKYDFTVPLFLAG